MTRKQNPEVPNQIFRNIHFYWLIIRTNVTKNYIIFHSALELTELLREKLQFLPLLIRINATKFTFLTIQPRKEIAYKSTD